MFDFLFNRFKKLDTELADVANNVSNLGISKADKTDLLATESELESLEDYFFTLNLFDYYAEDNVSGYIAYNGDIATNPDYMTTGFIKVKPNTRYYVAGGYKSEFGIRTVRFLLEYTEDKTPSTYHTDVPYYFTTNSTTKYIRFTYRAVQDKYRVGLSELEIPVSGLPLYDKKVNVRKSDVPQNQIRRITTKADSLGANSYLADTGMAFAPRKNSRIAFSGSFSSFSELTIGLRKLGGDNYNRLQITPTEITAYNYDGTTTTYEHGLTLEYNIQVLLEIGFAFNCNLTLVSNGVAFTQTNIRWDGKYNTFVFARPSMDMTDCVLSWTSKDLNKSIWMFGDSYFGYTDHWAFYLNQSGYIDNCLMDSYPGAGSHDAIKSLKTYLLFAVPQKVVWCMGMNDGSDTDSATPSSEWLTAFNELESLSKVFGFEIVVATIPSVPDIYHEGKNYHVRNSGYRVVDFAKAVGASSDGTWFGDMLSSDNVHPTNNGARALYMRFLADFPEIMISD